MNKKVRMKCSRCGSTRVVRDAAAVWNEKTQEWEMTTVFDHADCDECDSETTIIEEPIGIMSTEWRKPDQIINPFQFGHEARKPTCLWLKNLPLLKPTKIVGQGEFHVTKGGNRLPKWYNLPPSKDRWKIRSKTYEGIGQAMADQWG